VDPTWQTASESVELFKHGAICETTDDRLTTERPRYEEMCSNKPKAQSLIAVENTVANSLSQQENYCSHSVPKSLPG